MRIHDLVQSTVLAASLIAVCFSSSFLMAADEKTEDLINQLVETSEPGIGYSGLFSGSEFLPYEETGDLNTFVLGGTHRKRSATLRKIVEQGAAAVPTLLKHIGDDRKIQLKPLKRMMWIDFPDEYDYNDRTQKTPSDQVNRDDFGKKHPDHHAVTIGDLCFVALGQIVNRHYMATRYQPTAGLVINSPTYSKRLREAILKDWKSLTPEKHKQLLINDFKKPDYYGRRIGAYLRLSLYYPDTVEPLVLEELAKPTFDVFKVSSLCNDSLYETKDAKLRKQLYEAFIRKHGKASKDGILLQLFEDLDFLESDEAGKVSPPLTGDSFNPREVLIQLFNYPKDVKSTDCPIIETASAGERRQLVDALTHDKSKKIGEAIKQLFLKNPLDVYFAPECLACLTNRGFSDFLLQQLEKIDFSDTQTNDLHDSYLWAISQSKEVTIQAKLLDIIKTTKNEDYFISALSGLEKLDDSMVLKLVQNILKELPHETEQGGDILVMLHERLPKQAAGIIEKFVSNKSITRVSVVCEILRLDRVAAAKQVLIPFLDDRRIIPEADIELRVCDRVAQVISYSTRNIEFDAEWTIERKDEVILKLKEYYDQAKKNTNPGTQ